MSKSGPVADKAKRTPQQSAAGGRWNERSPQPGGPQDGLLGLQRAAGNRAVGAMLGGEWNTNETALHDLSAIIAIGLQASSQPLDTTSQSVMEQRFGEDFSQVQIHTGAPAAESAHQLDALAYTTGNHIVFADGQYAPHTPGGRSILAHELTHVVQQRSAGASRAAGLNQRGDVFERQANIYAAGHGVFAAQGMAFQPSGSPPAVQRQTAEEQAEIARAEANDEIQSNFINLLYSGPENMNTQLLLSYTLILNSHFTGSFRDPYQTRTHAASARALVDYHRVLTERERTSPRGENNVLVYNDPYGQGVVPWTPRMPQRLDEIYPFNPQNVLAWYSDARTAPESSSQRRRHSSRSRQATPPPFFREEPASQAPAQPEQAMAISSGSQVQEASSSERIGQESGGGGSEVGSGLSRLGDATLGQATQAIRTRLESTARPDEDPRFRSARIFSQQSDEATLLQATGQIWYVANHLYMLDRSGHIIPGDFAENTIDLQGSSLRPGTYFFSRFAVGLASQPRAQEGVLLRMDNGVEVAYGDLFPRTVLTGLLPLLEQGRGVLDRGGGIGIIISNDFGRSLSITDLDPDKIFRAVELAEQYLDWAIRVEVTRIREHLAEEAVQQAVGVGIGYIARLIPPVGAAMAMHQALRLAEWLGTVGNVAGYAQGDDELHIAAQAVAQKLAGFVVGEIISRGVHAAGRAGRGAVERVQRSGQARDTAGGADADAPPAPPAQRTAQPSAPDINSQSGRVRTPAPDELPRRIGSPPEGLPGAQTTLPVGASGDIHGVRPGGSGTPPNPPRPPTQETPPARTGQPAPETPPPARARGGDQPTDINEFRSRQQAGTRPDEPAAPAGRLIPHDEFQRRQQERATRPDEPAAPAARPQTPLPTGDTDRPAGRLIPHDEFQRRQQEQATRPDEPAAPAARPQTPSTEGDADRPAGRLVPHDEFQRRQQERARQAEEQRQIEQQRQELEQPLARTGTDDQPVGARQGQTGPVGIVRGDTPRASTQGGSGSGGGGSSPGGPIGTPSPSQTGGAGSSASIVSPPHAAGQPSSGPATSSQGTLTGARHAPVDPSRSRNQYPDFEPVRPEGQATAATQAQRLSQQLGGFPIPQDRILVAPYVGRIRNSSGEIQSSSTSMGLLRNESRFWAEFERQFPNDFALLGPGRRVTPALAQRYGWPTSVVGDRLIHHHIENGPNTVALPESLHVGSSGDIHSRPTVVDEP